MFDMAQESDSRGTLTRTMVHIISHGESSREGSIKLTEKGKNQMLELARSRIVTGISKLYTSPSGECTESTNILAREFDVRLKKTDCLSEISVGKKNIPLEEILEYFVEMWTDNSYSHDKGESFLESRRRMGECITSIAKKHSGDSFAVVTHPVVCVLFDTLVCGGDITKERFMDFGYASCASYEYSKDGWVLVMPFDNSFLSEPSNVSDNLTTE
ncbi:MAG: histidine phosphatase family protein [Candidatus Thorarchaeota archaeon]